MNMELSRRQFMVGASAGLAGTTLGALGFGEIEAAHAASIRPYKLALTKEARSTCPYCSVNCGMIIFSAQSKTEKGKLEAIHIEGDADNPVNRGTLCPKGAAALDFIRSETRVKYPMHRKPGTNKFERITWDFALDRIATLMKQDRDANFIEKNNDGVPVNRWPTMGFLSGAPHQTKQAG
jgi:formate dehydrogenase major subunit